MKPKEYRKKYLPWDEARSQEFIQELTLDFLSTWETVYALGQEKISLARCESLLSEASIKFSILQESFPILTPEVWKKINQSTLAPLKRDWCREELAEKRREAKKRREYQKHMDDLGSQFRDAFRMHDIFSLLGLSLQRSADSQALAYFGLNESSTQEDVQKAYRQKAKETHPDQGGSHALFLEATQMKNRALSHL